MSNIEISDEDLVKLVQDSGGNGFEEILERYQEKIFTYVNRLLKDGDMADDVAQNTFISAYENINSFDTNKKFSSWIYRIAHNKAINEIRSRKKTQALDENIEALSKEDAKNIQEKIDRYTARKILEINLKTLPIKYQEPIILKYFEEKSYEEISDILKIPTSTAGVRLRRGLNRLRKTINFKIEDYL